MIACASCGVEDELVEVVGQRTGQAALLCRFCEASDALRRHAVGELASRRGEQVEVLREIAAMLHALRRRD